jgi:WD40 repeat protein
MLMTLFQRSVRLSLRVSLCCAAILGSPMALRAQLDDAIWSHRSIGPEPAHLRITFDPAQNAVVVHHDAYIRKFSLANGRMLSMARRGGSVSAFTPDGRFLVRQSGGRLDIVDAVTGVTRSSQPSSTTSTIDFSEDSRTMIVGRSAIHSVPDGRRLGYLRTTMQGGILSSSRRYNVVYEGALFLYDLESLDPFRDARLSESNGHTAFAFGADGCVVGYNGAAVSVWSLESRARLFRVVESRPANHNATMLMKHEGRYAVTMPLYAPSDTTMNVYDVVDGRRVASHRMTQLHYPLQAAAITPDGLRLVAIDRSGIAMLVDIMSGKVIRQLNATSNAAASDAIASPDGTIVAVAQYDGAIRLLSARTGVLRRTIVFGDEALAPSHSFAFTADSRRLVGILPDSTLYFWDVGTGALLRRVRVAGGRRSIRISPDGRYIVLSGGGEPVVYDANSGDSLRSIPIVSPTRSTRFSPNGRYLALSAVNGVNIVDTETWQWVRRSTYGIEPWIVAVRDDGGLVVADTKRGNDSTELTLSPADSSSVLIGRFFLGSGRIETSSDGAFVVAACDDSIRVYDIESRRRAAIYDDPHTYASGGPFSPPPLFSHVAVPAGQQHFVVATFDGDVTAWRYPGTPSRAPVPPAPVITTPALK